MADHAGKQLVRLAEVAASIERPWNPKVVAELNGQHVRLARFEGEFIWHSHEEEDEMFLVLEGMIAMEFRDRMVELKPNELITVPRGVEHRPIGRPSALVLLFEPATTITTGGERTELTRMPEELERL